MSAQISAAWSSIGLASSAYSGNVLLLRKVRIVARHARSAPTTIPAARPDHVKPEGSGLIEGDRGRRHYSFDVHLPYTTICAEHCAWMMSARMGLRNIGTPRETSLPKPQVTKVVPRIDVVAVSKRRRQSNSKKSAWRPSSGDVCDQCNSAGELSWSLERLPPLGHNPNQTQPGTNDTKVDPLRISTYRTTTDDW